ncbi:MAG: tRNA glutamyl-Q(34) synthetase GluQRS [Gammaproteobacteria bacterium]|nr:tRNA glutamyl-Q(34) synthetase GluQRS [Gammaproteobacteria bacterium]
MTSEYVGRFAPTPSGPLHLGSLLTAVASWLDARARRGTWLLRIDDLDTPRVDPAAEPAILGTLESHGLRWDGPVHRQSDHLERHQSALRQLADRCFACACTRRELRALDRYPGTCRDRGLPRDGNALRVRAEAAAPSFMDRVQGHVATTERIVGDFIVQRRDGFASYPLAVVVDDLAMGVNNVVRGADLLDNTAEQLLVMRWLGIEEPNYAHLPVVVEGSGVKLSKHNRATAIDDRWVSHNLAAVLSLLGFDPPLDRAEAMLAWAVGEWDIARVPKGAALAGFFAIDH